MCRACMCDAAPPVPLFGGADAQMAADAPPPTAPGELLRLVAAVRPARGDGLPQQLCERCAACLDAAVAFRRQCERSDQVLHQYAAQTMQAMQGIQAMGDMDEVPSDIVKREHADSELPPLSHFDQADVDVDVSVNVGELDEHEYDDEFFMFKTEPETQLEERIKSEIEVKEENEPLGKRFKPHACSLCRKAYSNDKSLRRHMAVHQGKGYKCDHCKRIFARRDHLKKHLQCVHAVSDADAAMSAVSTKRTAKYECEYCGVDAPNKASMAKHTRACHRDKRSKRKNGSLDFDLFDGDESSEDGEDSDDDDEESESKTVSQVSASGGGAVATIKEERINSIDGKTRLILQVMYKCNVCGIEYDNQHSYAAHMTKHSGPLPKDQTHFSCTLCNKIFAKRKNLKQHLLTHNEEKANKCTLCHRAFTRPDQLILHMNNHTGKKRHQCMHCEKGFNMLSTLKDHLRTHSGEKPYLCSICGKGFSQNTNLKQHLMRHSATKPFGCNTCHAKFVSKGELDAHLRKHTGEHPFVCDTCGTGFTTSSSLVKHRRIHSGERPYACDLCPQRFTALGTLKNHRRTHTGEKPFECTHCGRAFTQKSDMVSHVRTHTGERPYVCSTCGAPFQQSSTLKAHIKTHHPQLKKPPIMITPLNTITLAGTLATSLAGTLTE